MEFELYKSIYANYKDWPSTPSNFSRIFFRLKPGCEEQLEAIEADIKCKLEKVEWLPNFYSLAPHIQIASSKSYQEGKVIFHIIFTNYYKNEFHDIEYN